MEPAEAEIAQNVKKSKNPPFGVMEAAHLSLIQHLSPDPIRGRINGINQVNVGGTMAVINLTNGVMADSIGAGRVLYILGCLFLVVMLITLKYTTFRTLYWSGLADSKLPK